MQNTNVSSSRARMSRKDAFLDLQVLRQCFNDLDEHLQKKDTFSQVEAVWSRRLFRLSRRIDVLSQLRMANHHIHFSDLILKHSVKEKELRDLRDLQTLLMDSIQSYSSQVAAFIQKARTMNTAAMPSQSESDAVVFEGQLLGPLWESFELSVLDFMMESYFGEISMLKKTSLSLGEFKEFRGSIAHIQTSIAGWIQSKEEFLESFTEEKPRIIGAVGIFMLRIAQFANQIDCLAPEIKDFDQEQSPCVPEILLTQEQLQTLQVEREKVFKEWKRIDQLYLELTMDAYLLDIGGQG